jgi:hypothetical protein
MGFLAVRRRGLVPAANEKRPMGQDALRRLPTAVETWIANCSR